MRWVRGANVVNKQGRRRGGRITILLRLRPGANFRLRHKYDSADERRANVFMFSIEHIHTGQQESSCATVAFCGTHKGTRPGSQYKFGTKMKSGGNDGCASNKHCYIYWGESLRYTGIQSPCVPSSDCSLRTQRKPYITRRSSYRLMHQAPFSA